MHRFFHIFDPVKYLRKRKMKKAYKGQLRDYINHIVPITQLDWSLFDKRLYYKEYSKNSILSETDEVENYMYFLVEGVTRICHFKNESDYTLRLIFRYQFSIHMLHLLAALLH